MLCFACQAIFQHPGFGLTEHDKRHRIHSTHHQVVRDSSQNGCLICLHFDSHAENEAIDKLDLRYIIEAEKDGGTTVDGKYYAISFLYEKVRGTAYNIGWKRLSVLEADESTLDP